MDAATGPQETQAQAEGVREKAAKMAEAKKEMNERLQMLQAKVIHGGGTDELAKKAKEQEALVQKRMKELEAQREKDREAQRRIQELERKREAKGQKFSSLQEERDAKKRELEGLWAELQGTQREVSDIEQEFASERAFLMEQQRELQSQLKLREAIIAAFVPADEQAKVMQKAVWDDEAEEWLLGQVSERAENALGLKRPTSASGSRRPMSSFAKSQAMVGDQNPRFKSENILTLELDMPERTTYVFSEEALMDPGVREALKAVFVDGQVLFNTHG